MRSKRTMLVVLMVVGLMAASLLTGCGSGSEKALEEPEEKGTGYAESIMVYSGAGMRKPMDEIGALFEKEHGTKVNYNYAGSNALLSQMEVTKEGDAYMPGETYYLDVAEEKGFIGDKKKVAYHIPAITVPVDNPAGIQNLQDMARQGVKLVWGDPEAAAIGRKGVEILEKNGIKDQAWANVISTVPTANELIVYISEKQADATINWVDLVKDVDKILVVDIPKEQNLIDVIPVGSLTFSKEKETADAFVDFCASKEALDIFEKYGFPSYPNPEYEVQQP